MKRLLFLFLICAVTFSGCKVLSPVSQRPINIPPSYGENTDSTGIANIKWQSFFKDEVLNALIDTALKNNFDLKIAIQRIEAARANVVAAKAGLLPTVTGVASAGVERYGKYTMNGVGNYDTNFSENISNDQKIPNPTPDYFLGLRSSWEIDLWGKLRNKKKAAVSRFLATEKAHHLVKTNLVAEVASRYYELLALDNELEIIRRNIKLQEKALELIKIQKMGGRATELAVQQFQAQFLNTKSLELEKEQEIYRTENQINLLLGRYSTKIRRGDSINKRPLPVEVKVGLPSDLLFRRPDIKQAELELEASEAEVEAARAAALPALTITPYIGLNSFNAAQFFNPASLAFGILGGLTSPVFNRNLIHSNYSRKAAENKEAYYTYSKTIINGYLEVLTSLRNISNLNKIQELRAQQVDILRNAVATSNDLFLSGYASYLEVITAQRNVIEAELDLVNIRKNRFLSLIDLYRTLGGGWE